MKAFFKIRTPIWSDPYYGEQCVGLLDSKLDTDNYIEVLYENKAGERLFPYQMHIPRYRAKQYVTRTYKGRKLRIIPISKLTVMPKFIDERSYD